MVQNHIKTLKKVFADSSKTRILVVGDLILDEYIWGEVSRISPEAPVQVVRWCSENCSMGGAANVANNLAALGCEVHLCGIIGVDEKGKILHELLKEANIHVEGINTDESRPTTSKLRIIARNQQVLRVDKEIDQPLAPEIHAKLLPYILKIIPHVDGIICSDYGKGVISESLLEQITKAAKSHGRKVITDPKGNDFSKYRNVDIITPNISEVETASGITVKNDEDLANCAKRLLDKLHCEAILVTRGKDGMSLFEYSMKVTNIPTEAKSVYDVTGAGDTVLSLFSAAVFSGHSLHLAARLANIAAGIAVGKVGAATVSQSEILEYIELGHGRLSNKIVTLQELKTIVAMCRNYEQKIAFTNGCFDLLHFGHIRYLQQAKKLGDILILGLNSDSSVRKLKGSQRPFIVEQQRAHILASLDCIDYIIIFPELDPLNIIDQILPDVLVKGGDYRVEEVVGRKIVEGNGGEVVIVPLIENLSTSSIVQNIVAKYTGKPIKDI